MIFGSVYGCLCWCPADCRHPILAVSKWQAPEMNQLLAGVAKRLAFFGCKLVKNFGVSAPFFSPLILGCVGQPWLLLDDITVFWFILSLISLLQAQLPLAKNPPRDHKSFSFWGYTPIVGNVSKFWAYWRHNPSLDLVWSSWMFWLTLICFRWMRFRYKDEAQDTLRESISIILSLVINPNLTSYLRFQDGELWSLSLRIMPPSNGWSDSLIFVG